MEHPLVIIGAGITGLTLAHLIRLEAPQTNPLLIEKSKGLGGRMATRRSPPYTFDHGAQFYPSEGMEFLHERFLETGRVRTLSSGSSQNCYSSSLGMTDFAKALAEGLQIHKETRVVQLIRKVDHWDLVLDQGAPLSAQQVVLTAPLPQALELLDASAIPYTTELRSITYDPALVILVGLAQSFPLPRTHLEFNEGEILSITDQMAKGVSAAPAWTVVMSPTFSALHFEEAPTVTLDRALQILKTQFLGIEITSSELKKWRYSRPKGNSAEPYAIISDMPLLILAGDAFQGPQISDAVRSAISVEKRLRK